MLLRIDEVGVPCGEIGDGTPDIDRAEAASARFIRANAEGYEPREENAFFFFNPFSAGVLRVVLRRIERARGADARLIFYYPSVDYEACLAEAGWPRPAGEIDCRDLFDGRDPRERVLIYDGAED